MSKEVRRVLFAAAGALALVLALGLGGCKDAWRILTTGDLYWEDDGDEEEEGEGEEEPEPEPEVRNLINLGDPQASTGAGWSYNEASGVFTISGGAGVEVRGSTARNRVVVRGTATVTLSDANIALSSGDASPLDLADGANVTLRLAGTNTLTASGAAAGVHVPAGRTLTITSGAGDGQTSGTLTVAGSGLDGNNKAGAGIGGSGYESSGIITIAGGTVNATGGGSTYGGYKTGGAGIGGGGEGGAGGIITISGGEVNATGGFLSAGIGGGDCGAGGNITISENSRGKAVTAFIPGWGDPHAVGPGESGGLSGSFSGPGALIPGEVWPASTKDANGIITYTW
ncbi:MAG: Ig domain protein group 2 domain protein [Treponematales bacterium]